jgi:hypothetical protein
LRHDQHVILIVAIWVQVRLHCHAVDNDHARITLPSAAIQPTSADRLEC